jgi:hypothetical protein
MIIAKPTIDIGVEDGRDEMQLGGLKGVVFREFDVDFELATCVG